MVGRTRRALDERKDRAIVGAAIDTPAYIEFEVGWRLVSRCQCAEVFGVACQCPLLVHSPGT